MTKSTDLADQLSEAAGAAFAALGLDPALGAMRRSDRPDLADFQCNGAMAAAKKLGKNPREIATAIVEALKSSPLVATTDVAGPGFINVKLSAEALSQRAEQIAADPRSGARTTETPRRVVIDFGGWNVAKEMHIGHLRSTVIGDSLQRLFCFMGDTVTSDVHLGDWGLQMGQLINEVKLEQPGLPYFDASNTAPQRPKGLKARPMVRCSRLQGRPPSIFLSPRPFRPETISIRALKTFRGQKSPPLPWPFAPFPWPKNT